MCGTCKGSCSHFNRRAAAAPTPGFRCHSRVLGSLSGGGLPLCGKGAGPHHSNIGCQPIRVGCPYPDSCGSGALESTGASEQYQLVAALRRPCSPSTLPGGSRRPGCPDSHRQCCHKGPYQSSGSHSRSVMLEVKRLGLRASRTSYCSERSTFLGPGMCKRIG